MSLVTTLIFSLTLSLFIFLSFALFEVASQLYDHFCRVAILLNQRVDDQPGLVKPDMNGWICNLSKLFFLWILRVTRAESDMALKYSTVVGK